MEDLDIKGILKIFLDKIRYVIVITTIALIICCFYTFYFITPKYKSVTTIVLANQVDYKDETVADLPQFAQIIKVNQDLVPVYSEIIKSKKIARQVIDNLKLDLSEKEFLENISIYIAKETTIISISVTNLNREDAAGIANEIVNVLSVEVADIYKMENIIIIDKAEIPEKAYNINHMRDLLLFFVIGIIISSIMIFIIYYLDTTIKNSDDVEKYVGLDTIANIPMIQKGLIVHKDKKKSSKLKPKEGNK